MVLLGGEVRLGEVSLAGDTLLFGEATLLGDGSVVLWVGVY